MNPRLAGQYADYLEIALKEYRSGKRPNPVMAGIVQTLGASEADPSRGAAYQRDETIRHGVYLRSRWIAPAVVASPTGSGKSCSGRAANFS